MLNGKSVLITGGTGSFGKQFTRIILQRYPAIRRIVIFSKSPGKQQQMAAELPDSRIEYIAGNMASATDVEKACKDIDIVVHTAAMRIVPEAENDPFGCICTNVSGAQNLIDSALKNNVKQILALSTDMASLANNVYGATKMLSDKLFIAAFREHPQLKTSVIRYGNMFGSAGTVIPFFIKKAKEDGVLPVTHPGMTRFMATLEDCAGIALNVLETAKGGEIVAPKIRSYNIMTIAQAVDANANTKTVGLRPGEKLYEEMITRYDSFNTIEAADSYIIVPPYADKEEYCLHYSAHPVAVGFEFNSENNPRKFTVAEIQEMIGNSRL